MERLHIQGKGNRVSFSLNLVAASLSPLRHAAASLSSFQGFGYVSFFQGLDRLWTGSVMDIHHLIYNNVFIVNSFGGFKLRISVTFFFLCQTDVYISVTFKVNSIIYHHHIVPRTCDFQIKKTLNIRKRITILFIKTEVIIFFYM